MRILPLAALFSACVLAACDDGTVKLCNFWPDEDVGGMDVKTDTDTGCQYVMAGGYRGVTPRIGADGRPLCLGPQKCRTISKVAWEAEKAAKAKAEAEPVLPVYDIRQCDEEWRTRFIINGVPNTQLCREAILKKEAAGEAHVIGREGDNQ